MTCKNAVCLILFLGVICNAQQGELVSVQVMFRHGARLPQPIDPNQQSFWDQVDAVGNPPTPACLTWRGVEEMEALATFLRDIYVDDLEFIGPDFDQNEVWVVADQGACLRRISSAEAFLRRFFPGASVPVNANAVEHDKLLLGDPLCPSFNSESEMYAAATDEFMETNYPDLVSNLTVITGFADAGIPLSPGSLVFVSFDNLDQLEANEYPEELLHPYIRANRVRMAEAFVTGWSGTFGFHRRGNYVHRWNQAILDNFQASVDDATSTKLYIFGTHGYNTDTLQNSWGIPFFHRMTGTANILELWRLDSGQYVVKLRIARKVHNRELDFEIEDFPLRCPDFEALCPWDQWNAFVQEQNGRDDGCCEITQSFHDYGCDDYFNADTLSTPVCRTYREWCPAVSCGPGGVLDKATLQCFRRA